MKAETGRVPAAVLGTAVEDSTLATPEGEGWGALIGSGSEGEI